MDLILRRLKKEAASGDPEAVERYVRTLERVLSRQISDDIEPAVVIYFINHARGRTACTNLHDELLARGWDVYYEDDQDYMLAINIDETKYISAEGEYRSLEFINESGGEDIFTFIYGANTIRKISFGVN